MILIVYLLFYLELKSFLFALTFTNNSLSITIILILLCNLNWTILNQFVIYHFTSILVYTTQKLDVFFGICWIPVYETVKQVRQLPDFSKDKIYLFK